VLDVTTASMFDGARLDGTEGLIAVRQSGPRDLRLVVEDAGTASADVVHAIAAVGAEVESIREVRLSFDEVFAELVERDRAAQASTDPAAERDHADAPDPDAGRASESGEAAA
jgi:hypothetical protein